MMQYIILILALLATAAPVKAAEEYAESPWRVGLAIGYGERSNPLIQSDDVPLIIDVDIAWFGKRAFFDNGDAGYTLHDGKEFTLSFVGRINSDRLFFSRTETRFVSFTSDAPGMPAIIEQVTVPDRDYALEAGFELLTDGDWGRLALTVYGDVSGTHKGYEIYTRYARGFRNNRWFFEPSLELSFKSAQQNDYFWGVDISEAGPLLPAYEVSSGVNISTRMLLSYQLDRHWAAVAVLNYEQLASTVSDSPLVKDDSVVGHYLGFQYRF